MKHSFYKTEDDDAPEVIKDSRGEVVLQMCRHCRKAEGEILSDDEECPVVNPPASDFPSPMKKAHTILREAAQTYEERNKVYGDNYIRVGKVMQAHFPDGLLVRSADDWNRLHIFLLGVVKDTRYITNWHSGGHMDSVRDRTVYSAMLEEIDTEINSRQKQDSIETAENIYRNNDESMEDYYKRLLIISQRKEK